MLNHLPRVTIAALKGGAGKTVISLGLVAAWRKKGYGVAAFKKGPDYIDAGWLSLSAGRPCHNLDSFMMDDDQIMESFLTHSADGDVSLIEGNRGLFDGFDLKGFCSTAELCKLLKTPVIIVADVTMTTRTVAALVMGCQRFDPDLKITAVVLNRVAGTRQESLVRTAIEHYCGIPVVGAVPKLKVNLFPERHMGLIPCQETEYAEKAISWARTAVEENLDVEAVWGLARAAGPLGAIEHLPGRNAPESVPCDPPRIGFIRDSAFWFYYPENLEHLRNLGALLVEVNSITDRELPDLDALYIGGGFPETQAEALADNRGFRESLKQRIEKGLPVYAECGGLMYLGEFLRIGERSYPMVGALPITCLLEKKPQGHGYTVLEVTGENPFFPEGEVLKGHEFHYSRPLITASEGIHSVFKVRRGHGLDGKHDGLCKKNLLATYTHLHAGGNLLWGKNLFRAALYLGKKLRDSRKEGLTT